MDDIQLKKLKKRELINRLEEKNERCIELEQRLDKRDAVVGKAGSMAQAALQLSGIFEAADEAVTQYLESLSAGVGVENTDCIRKMYDEIKEQRRSQAIKVYEDERLEQAEKRAAEYEEELREQARNRVMSLEEDVLNKIKVSFNEYSIKTKEKIRTEAEQYENALLEQADARCKEKLCAAEEQAQHIIDEAYSRSKLAMQKTEQKCREREIKMQNTLEEYSKKMKEIKEKYMALIRLFDNMPD
ncbi:MAG: hypothetical protein MJ177_02775 [Clostridia bacterium]|nr:hypothetical protein [Clostridia bacterium]